MNLARALTTAAHHPLAMRAKRTLRSVKWHFDGVRIENPPLPADVRSVLFVCLGNICRSPFASAVAARRYAELEGRTIRIESAGIKTSQAARSPREACTAAAEFGVSLAGHRPVPVTPELIDTFDLIVVMEVSQVEQLRAAYPDAARRIVLLPLFDDEARGLTRYQIDDPFMLPVIEFRHCYQRIDRAVIGLIRAMRPAPRPVAESVKCGG